MPIIRTDVGGVTTLTIDRQERLNALDIDTRHEFVDHLVDIRGDETRRALVITGAGKAFCTGADVQKMNAHKKTFAGQRRTIRGSAHRYVTLIHDLDIPVIAAVHGHAAGIGWSIALAADIIIASDAAKFTAAFTRIGLAPDGGLVWFLSRAVGAYAAKEIVYTARTVGAEEAAKLGMVTRVTTPENLQSDAAELAEKLASGPTLALALAKRQFMAALNPGLNAFLEHEALMQPILHLTDDNAEGVAAFAAKRPAVFKGE